MADDNSTKDAAGRMGVGRASTDFLEQAPGLSSMLRERFPRILSDYTNTWSSANSSLGVAEGTLFVDKFIASIKGENLEPAETQALEKDPYTIKLKAALDDQKANIIYELGQKIRFGRDDVLSAVQRAYDGLKLEHTTLRESADVMTQKLGALSIENQQLKTCLLDLVRLTERVSLRRQVLVISGVCLAVTTACLIWARASAPIVLVSPWPEIGVAVSLLFFWIAKALPKKQGTQE